MVVRTHLLQAFLRLPCFFLPDSKPHAQLNFLIVHHTKCKQANFPRFFLKFIAARADKRHCER